MYTKNQVSIVDTEQKIDIVVETLHQTTDHNKEIYLKLLLKQLRHELVELYSKE